MSLLKLELIALACAFGAASACAKSKAESSRSDTSVASPGADASDASDEDSQAPVDCSKIYTSADAVGILNLPAKVSNDTLWPGSCTFDTANEGGSIKVRPGASIEMAWDDVTKSRDSVKYAPLAGIGERAGNTPMEETAMALLTLYGVDTGLNYAKFFGLAHMVAELSQTPILPNRPVVGDQLFHIESGIIASWFQNCGADNPTELFPYRWDVVGQPPAKIVFGKGSGIDSIKGALKSLGLAFTEDEAMKVLAAVKQFSLERKRLLTPDEFKKVATETLTKVSA